MVGMNDGLQRHLHRSVVFSLWSGRDCGQSSVFPSVLSMRQIFLCPPSFYCKSDSTKNIQFRKWFHEETETCIQPRQNSRAVVQDQAQDLPQLDIITVLVIKSLFSSDWKDNLLSVADHNPNQFHIAEPAYTLEWQIPLRNRYHSIAVNKAPLLVVPIYCLSVQLLFSLCCCWTYLQTPFQGGAGIARRANNPQICYIIWHDFKGREKRRFILLCKIYLLKFQHPTFLPTSPSLFRSSPLLESSQ